MTSIAISIDLQEELAALKETGLYTSEESVLNDALQTFFAARPDLRKAVGARLYEKGRFSLGRAAEWCGISIEELKDELRSRGIRRVTEDDPAAIEAMASRGLEIAGRAKG